jgi:hypothetical protein
MTPEERAEFVTDLAIALHAQTDAGTYLSDEERQWVRMAIRKEAQSIAFRQAVIEKTLGGLVWSTLAFLGYLALQFLQSKGFKP